MSLGFIKNVLYSLEREYGKSIDLYYKSNITNDLTLAKTTWTLNKIHIPRAIVLPQSVNRNQFLIQHGGGEQIIFKHAGNIDIGTQDFIINKKYIKTLKPTKDWWIVYNHLRFNVETVQDFRDNKAYYITSKNVEGSNHLELFEKRSNESISIADGVEVNVE